MKYVQTFEEFINESLITVSEDTINEDRFSDEISKYLDGMNRDLKAKNYKRLYADSKNLVDVLKHVVESKDTVSEGVGKGNPDIVKVMKEIEEWDADMMETLLSDIATNYKINAPELDNMDAMGIYKHIMEAVKLLKKRTGN